MSENYIVSARKYRPQTFDTVIGQSHITTTLKNAIKNHQLAHAFLFCGPRGVGKTTCARILAKTINCEHPTAEMEACGSCSSCVGFKNNNLFNVFELDAASNNSVDDIRELINQVRFAPQQGRYKVYIIDEVHMLSSNAFNAFLKTLEEPPPYAIFILATTEKHKIIPTILSRCQIFDFKRITTNDTVLHLQQIAENEGMRAEEAALHVIAQKSEGCMRDSLSMLDRISGFTGGNITYSNTMEHLNMLDADFYFMLTDMLLSQDVAGTLLQLDGALERGFEGDTLVSGLAEHFRNLLLCKDSRMAKLLDVPSEHKRIFFEKANQMPPSYIISSLSVINDSELEYKNAANKRLHVEMCLIRLCYVLQATQPMEIHSADEKKNSSPIIGASQQQQESEQSVPKSGSDSLKRFFEPKTNSNGSYVAEQAETVVVSESAPIMPTAQQQVSGSVHAFSPKSETASRRLSRNLLQEIEASLATPVVEEPIALKEFSNTEIEALFNNYCALLQQSGEDLKYAQFNMMQAVFLPPDEIRINCSTGFNESYAKGEKNALSEYFTKATQRFFRITTFVTEQERQQPKVMTKNEVFEWMVQRKPNLATLYNTLNMQIEY
jgi:DNA polymerase III subunit gamma/tau